jgi:hypothetical protein
LFGWPTKVLIAEKVVCVSFGTEDAVVTDVVVRLSLRSGDNSALNEVAGVAFVSMDVLADAVKACIHPFPLS